MIRTTLCTLAGALIGTACLTGLSLVSGITPQPITYPAFIGLPALVGACLGHCS